MIPANPVYAETIVRGLSFRSQKAMDQRDYSPLAPAYLSKDGRLDMDRLFADFQEFWREHSAIWVEGYQYKEAAPHLILTAFFQRVINAGGTIGREFASGRGRLDMCVHYNKNRYPVEIKLRRSAKTCEEGKKQLAEYMDTLGCDEGWLVVFDRREKIPWKNKLFRKSCRFEGVLVHVVGC